MLSLSGSCLRLLLLLMLFPGAACAPTPPPVLDDPPLYTGQSAWGGTVEVTRAPQTAAPAFALLTDARQFGWIGSDAAGVHQDVRMLAGGKLSPAAALPLDPVQPRDLRMIRLTDDTTLLLYLDGYTVNGETDTRLFSAVVGRDTSLKFGPVPVSHEATLNYAVDRLRDGQVWVIWTGGLIAEPALYLQRLDHLGRPRPAARLAEDVGNAAFGHHPALDTLYWLSHSGRTVYRGTLSGETLSTSAALTDSVRLAPGERLVHFSTGEDTTSVYLFWNTVTADGTPHTWFTSGTPTAERWSPPQQLTITIDTASAGIITGYNGGAAFQAVAGGKLPVWWTSPLTVQADQLAVAAQAGNDLGILYWRSGVVIGWQPVVTLTAPLIGLPALQTDRERHLYLAWAEPVSPNYALLNFTATHPLD